MNEQACANTDKEIWREIADDYYSPSIHVTTDGKIGINLGGTVIVRDIRYWHRLASEELDKTEPKSTINTSIENKTRIK